MKQLLVIIASLLTTNMLTAQVYDMRQTWGFNAELLQYGGSFGGIWQMDLNPEWALGAEANWTFVQTGQSLEFYDPYTGRYYQVGSQNLSMLKFLGGISWYPFAESMDPSFQFGFYTGVGPILAMDTNDETADITRWRYVRGYPSIYAKLGLEFKIHQQGMGIYILRLGFDGTQFETEIDGQSRYQGIFLQVGMEFPRYR
ncbi:MAG: hypothetical protein K9N11_09190 [Lentisphaeria bacterium]|nr:hypothetical protein [Candidatus Neomarinimicrobiota bacterium]MCF7843013.1 hypothetical protein [Lentisphaeria bacterium]